MKNSLLVLFIIFTIFLAGCISSANNMPTSNSEDSRKVNNTVYEDTKITNEDFEEDTEEPTILNIDNNDIEIENESPSIANKQPNQQKSSVVAGNNNNYGLVATDGEWIVYANAVDTGGESDRKLYLSDMQLNNIKKLSDDEAEYVNLVNGWVYYSNLSERWPLDRSLYRIRIDGSDREKVFDGASEYMFFLDDWIYFFNGSDKTELGSYLCKMKTDGSCVTRLDDGIGEHISIVDDWIYFLRREAAIVGIPRLLNRIKLDGTSKEQIYEDEILDLVVTNNMVYFCNTKDNNKIYKMTLDGQEIEKLNDDPSANINVYMDWIYYTSVDEGERLYRIKTDGSCKELLHDGRSFAINIVGEWVFFDAVFADWTEQRRMRLYGSDNQLAENEKNQ